uniref:Uncharacterized protein n=1 Tax=Catagonus wagneri TaxID=51154 RepID=A0A8C3WUX5_9CETA
MEKTELIQKVIQVSAISNIKQKAYTSDQKSQLCKVFYLKMKGDYFWCLAENARGSDQKQMIDNFQGASREAFDAAYTPSLSGALKFLCFSVRSL